jgi:hypothetical protein
MNRLSIILDILINFAISMGGIIGLLAIYRGSVFIIKHYVYPELFEDKPKELPPPQESVWPIQIEVASKDLEISKKVK